MTTDNLPSFDLLNDRVSPFDEDSFKALSTESIDLVRTNREN